VAEVERNDYSAHTLINAVVMSMPFRYQAGAAQSSPAKSKTSSLPSQKEKKNP
jgi:hypothetical protein